MHDRLSPYEVVEYSPATLQAYLYTVNDVRHAPGQIVRLATLKEHFSPERLSAKTMIVENFYVDKDYLEDHAAYYDRCLRDYPNKCRRIHFFSIAIAPDEFDRILTEGVTKDRLTVLSKAYLGFIVTRPLPETVIGRSCLQPYYDDGGLRKHPCTRTYTINLFGLDLSVDTLAYQEQDRVVGACATSAIWTLLQGTSKAFDHPSLSPAQITRLATDGMPLAGRMFPNEGLSMEQMAYACHAIGLDTVYTSLLDDGRRRPIADGQAHELLVNTVYAYLRGGVPLALGMCLFDEKRSEEEDQYIGSHVVAVTGYRVGDSIRAFSDEEPFLTKASAIDMLFVHDDQVGPFAPMSFEHDPTTFGAVILGNGADTLPSLTLTTGWGDDAGNPGSVVAIPDNLLVALYHKIRIQYRTIHEGIRLFDAILRDLSCPIAPLVWDIYLTSVGDVKRELLQEAPALSSEIRWNVLTKPMPRFIWRATASSGDKNVVDLFFDATGIEQDSLLVCCPLEYQTTVGDFIRSLLSDPTEAAALDQQFSSEWRSRPGRFAQKLLAGFMPLQNETSDACCPHTCGA